MNPSIKYAKYHHNPLSPVLKENTISTINAYPTAALASTHKENAQAASPYFTDLIPKEYAEAEAVPQDTTLTHQQDSV